MDRAARVLGELRELARDLAVEHGAPRQGAFPVEAVRLGLDLPMGGPAAVRAAAEVLVETLRGRLGEALRGATAFREGHVYCFFTDSPESPYSRPSTPTEVFVGYAANGKPVWESFPNLCLARREPRVDRLYASPPEVVALALSAAELSGELLPGFGRDSLAYAVLGQVVVGLVPRDLDPGNRDAERVALTLQVVETTQGTARHRLRFNVLGLPPEAIAIAAAEGDPRGPAEAFRQVLRATRQRVDSLGRQLALAARQGERLDREVLVQRILGRLRADVLRVFKLRAYRTQHAAARHKSGERPTGVALKDARAAGDGRLLRDTQRHTVIVVGPRGRAHVFTPEGKHVTSLQLDDGELERKSERGRWRPLDRADSERFRQVVEAEDVGS